MVKFRLYCLERLSTFLQINPVGWRRCTRPMRQEGLTQRQRLGLAERHRRDSHYPPHFLFIHQSRSYPTPFVLQSHTGEEISATMSPDTTHSHHAVEKDTPEDKNSKQVPKEEELRNKASPNVWLSTCHSGHAANNYRPPTSLPNNRLSLALQSAC